MPAGGGAPIAHTRYHKGDFLYVMPDKNHKESSIVQVERVWTNESGATMIYGTAYFRYPTYNQP